MPMVTPAKDTIRRMLAKAVDDRIFSGAVLVAAHGSTIRLSAAVGLADCFTGQPMTPETELDLASLTKPLATTLVVMALEGEGRLDVNAPMGEVLAATVGTDKADLTLRQLLTHTSGLPGWRPYFADLRHLPGPDRVPAMMARVMAEPLVAIPGHTTEYSDLGFMMVGWAVEAATGQPLDVVVRERVYAPLGIDRVGFRRLSDVGQSTESPPLAAGQICPWRGRLLKGEVDDDNAHVMGGVAGHAGVFGTAGGVHRLLTALWEALNDRPPLPWMTLERVHRYLDHRNGERALGFDVPTPPDASCGRWFPESAVGHLGFTGTSFWFDPGSGAMVVLLSNRGHPYRFAEGIRAFRPRLHDAVMTGLFHAE